MKCFRCGCSFKNSSCPHCGMPALRVKMYSVPIIILGVLSAVFCFFPFPMNLFSAVISIIIIILAASQKAKPHDIKADIDKIVEYSITEEALAKINNLNLEINNLNLEINHHNETIKSLLSSKKDLESDIVHLMQEYDDKSIFFLNVEDLIELNSEQIRDKLALLKIEESSMLKDGKCVHMKNASRTTKSILNNKVKRLVRCFTSDCTSIIQNATVKNIDTCRTKIQRSYETLNKLFNSDNISLTKAFLELKLKQLNLVYEYQNKKALEKEEQMEIRRQMIEEEKIRREIEREKAKIEKEEAQFRGEIKKLIEYLQKASDIEKKLYVDKINELEAKLKLLEKDKENVLDREQNTRSGFVYIISNIGSFGEDIYKIGMTRRLEPMDRIKELSSASVPFEFDVHAMIFSEDAPKLENLLHSAFKDRQVNKVNPRKEFFKVGLDEIELLVKDKYNATVTFTKIAEANQYRQSMELAKNNKSY